MVVLIAPHFFSGEEGGAEKREKNAGLRFFSIFSDDEENGRKNSDDEDDRERNGRPLPHSQFKKSAQKTYTEKGRRKWIHTQFGGGGGSRYTYTDRLSGGEKE